MSVKINPPRTPVTEGSSGVATATVPNVCKMPGPPAPFVPAPLPNIGKSGLSPAGYSKTVTIEGKKVAIKGATFKSMGDIASKGTGGGLISANCEGITSFVGPGSMDVKIEGKNVQLLGDPMLNNCGPSGSPPNAATLMGVIQRSGMMLLVKAGPCPVCHGDHGGFKETPATHADAGGLARAYFPVASRRTNTMLAVLHCKTCGIKYADHSGTTNPNFCTVAAGQGMRHPDPAQLQAMIDLNREQGTTAREVQPGDASSEARAAAAAARVEAAIQAPFRRAMGDRFEDLWRKGTRLHDRS